MIARNSMWVLGNHYDNVFPTMLSITVIMVKYSVKRVLIDVKKGNNFAIRINNSSNHLS